MADTLTRERRRYCMSRVRGKDTKPEMIVRRLIHALGYRYRLHQRDLPGCPDLVFASHRKVIFVNGCFWHRHRCRKGRTVPAIRRDFWTKKLEANRNRDIKNRRQLRRNGWDVMVIWECQTRDAERLVERLAVFLGPRPTD